MDDAKLVFQVLDKYPGLDGRRCSRFAEMAASIQAGEAAIIPSSRGDFPIVTQATKDLTQFAFIWHVLRPTPEQKDLWQRFSNLFADDPLPSKSRPTKDARRDQFELFCQAMLTRCGFNPNHQGVGADFQCELPKLPVGSSPWRFVVEAKTARSIRRVSERLTEAAVQIKSSGLPGFILIDYTFAVNARETEHVITSRSQLQNVGAAQRARWAVLRKRVYDPHQRMLADHRVVGVGYVDQLVVQDGVQAEDNAGRWQLAVIHDHVKVPCTEKDAGLARTVFELLTDVGLPVGPEPC